VRTNALEKLKYSGNLHAKIPMGASVTKITVLAAEWRIIDNKLSKLTTIVNHPTTIMCARGTKGASG